MKKRKGEDLFRVQCHECGKIFDFADYLKNWDDEKIMAEVVLEKCKGDNILCDECVKLNRKIIEKGNFQWVAKGPGGFRISDLELMSDDGKQAIFKVKDISDNTITFEAKRSDFDFS